MYSKCDPLLLSWQQRRSRVSLHWVAINSFAACFWVCDTVGFHHCVLGKSFVVVSVGLLPLSLFALLSFGWWDANLAGGSASCLLFLVVCVLVFMICHAACDHLCPCRSFLDNSFFSFKDRALERDRPYQREKKLVRFDVAFWLSNYFQLPPWTICNYLEAIAEKGPQDLKTQPGHLLISGLVSSWSKVMFRGYYHSFWHDDPTDPCMSGCWCCWISLYSVAVCCPSFAVFVSWFWLKKLCLLGFAWGNISWNAQISWLK